MLWGVVWALTPTAVLAVLFWYVMRIILHADRKERATYAQIEAEERARLARRDGDAEHADRSE